MTFPDNFSMRRSTLHKQVAEKLQQLMISESLLPGHKLPSERALAERLDVSRTVIREAMRVLSAQGLLEVKPGSGTYIRELSLNDAAASIGLYLDMHQVQNHYKDLMEIRRTLEIEIVGLAAERASGEDIVALETAVEEIERNREDAETFIRADLAFHECLAKATHNVLYSILLAPIADLQLKFRLAAYKHDQQATVEGALDYHRRILERVRDQDTEGARQVMQDHLDQAQRVIEAAYEGDTRETNR